MGISSQLAEALGGSPAHRQMIDNLKEQLLIVFINRLGGSIDVPVTEIDGTGQYSMYMAVDPSTREFHFEVKKLKEAEHGWYIHPEKK